MILLISGPSHTGKTALAHRLMRREGIPYLSIDHLKMGLIRSGQTALTPCDADDALTAYLWPILREMIKTAIENDQSMIIEGCYIPFDWRESFGAEYLPHIRAVWLVMTQRYLQEHEADIRRYASVVENRGEDEDLDLEALREEHARTLERCRENGCEMVLIDEAYEVDVAL